MKREETASEEGTVRGGGPPWPPGRSLVAPSGVPGAVRPVNYRGRTGRAWGGEGVGDWSEVGRPGSQEWRPISTGMYVIR